LKIDRNTMSEAERLAERVNSGLEGLKAGTLRFWGEWFGRPYDNIHQIVGCKADGDFVRIRFNDDEVLGVWSPREPVVGPRTFKISNADRIRWEWFLYGRPKVLNNRRFIDFVMTAAGIKASTDIDWYSPGLKVSSAHPAVEIVNTWS
jgi:hypothetical protein